MLQKRYQGFLNTSFLWQNEAVFHLKQFETSFLSNTIDISVDERLRLGKYVERLVSFELQHQENIKILAENIQIQNNKITLGELDCLLLKNDTPIHLEIIYKFYLYDDSVGTSELEHFIGPNRKDSLIEKLYKLKEKQLPLLYSEACKDYLKTLNIAAQDILQQVYFKAQLFLPYNTKTIKLSVLNNDCVVGFYINQSHLMAFKDCKFFIPVKKDWLVEVDTYVDWLSFETFKSFTENDFKERFSTLCWVKHKTGRIKKVFLVWW